MTFRETGAGQRGIFNAVNSDGRREIIGMGIGESEAKAFWLAFLLSLKERGMEGVKLVISDSHSGLKAATQQVFCAPLRYYCPRLSCFTCKGDATSGTRTPPRHAGSLRHRKTGVSASDIRR